MVLSLRLLAGLVTCCMMPLPTFLLTHDEVDDNLSYLISSITEIGYAVKYAWEIQDEL